MERRKRKSALENYLDGLADPPEKMKKVSDFYAALRQFYKRKWNAPLKLPCVQGVEVNLYRLYDTVMVMGGWQKVSHHERWPDVADMLGVGEDVVTADHAIKLIYMRYLSKYEQNETIGDIDDMMMDGEMSRSRGRQVSFFATNECPISRSGDYLRRDERGNPSMEPDYSRVMRSLLSGLPNEVDFGVNVCTLLSHPGPRLLRLSHAPHIPTLLVAHCGVFDEDDCDLSDLYAVWRKTTGRDFAAFWANSGAPKEFLEKFVPMAANLKVDKDSEFLHGIALEYDVRNPISWRLNQIATIIRNFSFEPINRVTLTECWPLMKFLFLCASSQWVPLYTAALDTLSNIASDINLAWNKMTHTSDHALLRILSEGIMSNDKFKLIRSMEIITGLCIYEENESVLCEFITSPMIERIFNMICVKDIMMCVYALECLYQMSEMGDVACDLMVKQPRCIQQLVSMATLEAVSFGQAGLAGMKVVEYQPPHGVPSYQMQPAPGGYYPQQAGQPMQAGPPQVHYQQPHQMQQMHPGQSTPHPGLGGPMPPHGYPPHQQQHPGMQQRMPFPTGTPLRPGHPIPHMTPHQPQVQQRPIPPTPVGESKIDQLTEQWIRQNCHSDPNSVTPRGELYAAYVDDLRNQYHSLSGSLTMFSNVMRNIHPDVQFKMADNGLMMVAQGIRLVKPHKLAPAASAQASVPTPNGISATPLMKQMLTKVPPPTMAVNPATVTNGTSHDSSRSTTPHDDTDMLHPPVTVVKQEPTVKSEIARRILQEAKKTNGVANGKVEYESEASDEEDESKSKPLHEEKPSVINENGHESTESENASVNELMCEWDGCGLVFATNAGVLIHCSKEHMIDEPQPCRWPGCDGTPRSKWSLVTHIQDHHAQEHLLKAAAQKRRDGTAPVKPLPYRTDVHREIPQHPGYSKHAAIDAIRRHAFNFLPRDITDEPEGPVTKSIRLTSCLILRNLARYSAEGRHLLRRHERHLCWLALSRLESSHALSQLLSELHPTAEEEAEAAAEAAATAAAAMDVSQMPAPLV